MQILLINPVDRDFMPPSIFPLGLAYIAAVLGEHGHTVDVVDLNGERKGGEAMLADKLRAGTFDWIGISSMITQYRRVKDLVRKIKSLAPRTPVVLGGPGPTSHPRLYLEYTEADLVVVGEGEQTVLALCSTLETGGDLSNCPGLYIRDSGRICVNPARQPLDQLDVLPLPAWEAFPATRYMESFLFKTADTYRGMNVLTSRGCPGKCTYCMRNFGNRVRLRSVAGVITEVKRLITDYGIGHLHFIDDTIGADRTRLDELSRALASLNSGITWSANARVSQVSPETLKLMAAANCTRLAYGIESADVRILKEMRKGTTPRQASRAIAWTREAGIDVTAYFMIGFPSETADTIRNTVDFCKTNLVGGEFFFVTPLPGTEIYAYARDAGLIQQEDLYIEQVGEIRNFLINVTRSLPNEELFRLKENAEQEIQAHLQRYGQACTPSIREDPRETVKSLPNFGSNPGDRK